MTGKLIKPFSCDKSDEKDRYLPLSIALNTILSEFGDVAFGTLLVPNATEGKEQVIYSPNDPTVIESKHLHTIGYHKPDIVGMFVSSLCKIYKKFEESEYKDFAKLISDNSLIDEAEQKPDWKDAIQTWELKVDKPKLVYEEHTWTLDEVSHSSDQSSAKANLKRTKADNNDNKGNPALKKSCVIWPAAGQSARPSIRPRNTTTRTPLPKITHDVHCGFYGIDRLTASWTIMHCTVLLLKGECTLCH